MNNESKALELASALENEEASGRISNYTARKSSAELRRQHTALQDLQTECTALRVNEENLTAQVESLRAQLEQKSERIANLEATASSNYGRGHADAHQMAARVPDSFLSELKAAKSVCDKSEKIDREKVYGRILAPYAAAMLSAAPSQQAPCTHEVPPVLVRDLASIIGSTVPDVCAALVKAGKPPRSTNMAVSGEEAVEVALMLRAQQAPVAQGEPVAWMWQHEETGRTGFVDAWQVEQGWQKNNPRNRIVGPLYTTSQQASEPMTMEQKRQSWVNATIEQCSHEGCYMRGIEDAERHHQIKGKQ